MNSEIVRQAHNNIEDEVTTKPSAIEFEMAYQSRVAIDRIRFAIKHAEQFVPPTDHTRAAGLQLLDALHRLETVDRRFQDRSRNWVGSGRIETPGVDAVVNGTRRSA